MEFEWDPRKNLANQRKHGLAFEDAELVFRGMVLTGIDRRIDYGEARFVTFGRLHGRLVQIVHVMRGDRIRVISMRKANEREEKAYKERLEALGFDVR